MSFWIKDWLRRLNSRETILIVIVIGLVLSGRVDTVAEAIAIGGPVASFIVARQYTKAKSLGAVPSEERPV